MENKMLKVHEDDYNIIRDVAFNRKVKMINLLHEMVQDLPEVKK